jgi:aerobic-type carbon monoxide dehydrogenase small subunit (CoxS/CutS family)
MARRPPPPHDESEQPSFSRRSFLKSAGVGAAATTIVGAGETATAQAQVLGPGEVALNLKVNGAAHTVTVEPRVTLLDALRNHLDLTGAKPVCERGGCGACTVLLDGAPVVSCLMLAADAEGHAITTVEGIGTPEKMSPLQAAFVEKDALQCGFCTPGFVVSGTALLAQNPSPSREEIQEGLAGNLCRCGTYGRVIEAVEHAARQGGRKRTAAQTAASSVAREK